MNLMHKAIHKAVFPVLFLVEEFHDIKRAKLFKRKRHAKIAIGMVFIAGGSAISHVHIFLPLFWEAFGWLLHGYGALPIIKVLCEKYDLEMVKDEVEAEVKKIESEVENDLDNHRAHRLHS